MTGLPTVVRTRPDGTEYAMPCCPLCGTDFDEHCAAATPPAWDPTVGVRSTDQDRHKRNRTYRTGGVS